MEKERVKGENDGTSSDFDFDGSKPIICRFPCLNLTNRLCKVSARKIKIASVLTSKQSDVQGGATLVVALVQIGAVVGIRTGGARVEVRISCSCRGLGEQGAEGLRISLVGSIMKGALYMREMVRKEGERERECGERGLREAARWHTSTATAKTCFQKQQQLLLDATSYSTTH